MKIQMTDSNPEFSQKPPDTIKATLGSINRSGLREGKPIKNFSDTNPEFWKKHWERLKRPFETVEDVQKPYVAELHQAITKSQPDDAELQKFRTFFNIPPDHPPILETDLINLINGKKTEWQRQNEAKRQAKEQKAEAKRRATENARRQKTEQNRKEEERKKREQEFQSKTETEQTEREYRQEEMSLWMREFWADKSQITTASLLRAEVLEFGLKRIFGEANAQLETNGNQANQDFSNQRLSPTTKLNLMADVFAENLHQSPIPRLEFYKIDGGKLHEFVDSLTSTIVSRKVSFEKGGQKLLFEKAIKKFLLNKEPENQKLIKQRLQMKARGAFHPEAVIPDGEKFKKTREDLFKYIDAGFNEFIKPFLF